MICIIHHQTPTIIAIQGAIIAVMIMTKNIITMTTNTTITMNMRTMTSTILLDFVGLGVDLL